MHARESTEGVSLPRCPLRPRGGTTRTAKLSSSVTSNDQRAGGPQDDARLRPRDGRDGHGHDHGHDHEERLAPAPRQPSGGNQLPPPVAFDARGRRAGGAPGVGSRPIWRRFASSCRRVTGGPTPTPCTLRRCLRLTARPPRRVWLPPSIILAPARAVRSSIRTRTGWWGGSTGTGKERRRASGGSD